MDPETQRLINLLKAMLRILGMSHRQIARRLKMSPSYLSKLFSGVSELRLDHVIRICRAAEIEPAELFNLAYPHRPAASSLAARRIQELLQTGGLPPPTASQPSTAFDDRQVEAMLKAMLERLLERKSKGE